MTYTNQSTIEAINTLIENKISQLKFDKIIIAEISKILDYQKGIYQISYQNNKITVYSQDTTKIYKVGDSVLIQIPSNDWSSTKYIIGLANKDYNNDITLTSYYNNYEEIGQPFNLDADQINSDAFKHYWKNSDYFKIIAKIRPKNIYEKYNSTLNYVENSEVLKDGQIQKFINENNQLVWKNTNKIEFGDEAGLNLIYNVGQDNQTAYTFRQKDIVGNFYYILDGEENSNEEQEVYFQIVKENKTNENISFAYSIDDSSLFNYENVKIQFLQKNETENNMYMLKLEAPDGKVGKELNLLASLYHYGTPILSSECSFYWYVKDLRIQEKNLAGYGWKPIESTATNIITLKDIIGTQIYKVVVIYHKEEITISKEITLSSPDKVEPDDDGIQYYGIALNGNYYLLNAEPSDLKIFYKQLLKNKKVIGIEEVYNPNAGTSLDGPTIYEQGQFIFLYDQNNTILQEEAAKERLFTLGLQEKIISWQACDGTFLTSSEKYTPMTTIGDHPEPLGMLENMWIENNILHFQLNRNLDREKRKNYVLINYEKSDGSIGSYKQYFYFIAEGDIGTNGTGYAVLVEPVDDNGKILENPSMTEQGITLKAFVINELGQIINDTNNNLQFEYYWTDASVEAGPTYAIDSSTTSFVPLTIKFRDKKQIKLYYNYVIIPQGNDKPREELTSYIKYNREGKYPEYIVGPNQWDNEYSAFSQEEITYELDGIEYKTFCYLDLHDSADMDAWDGTSVKIKDDSSIFSPTIGAGKKETADNNTNVFTGFLMGKNSGDNNKIGLYGFNKGEPTFKVNEDGEAYFSGSGIFKGELSIGEASNSNKSPIFHVSNEGRLTLRDNSGDTIFSVNNNGNATFKGTISGSTISGRSSISIGNRFKVDNNGYLEASEVDISGTINAEEGYIGKWQIDDKKIYQEGKYQSGEEGTTTLELNGLSLEGEYTKATYNSGYIQLTNKKQDIALEIGSNTTGEGYMIWVDGGPLTIDAVSVNIPGLDVTAKFG